MDAATELSFWNELRKNIFPPKHSTWSGSLKLSFWKATCEKAYLCGARWEQPHAQRYEPASDRVKSRMRYQGNQNSQNWKENEQQNSRIQWDHTAKSLKVYWWHRIPLKNNGGTWLATGCTPEKTCICQRQLAKGSLIAFRQRTCSPRRWTEGCDFSFPAVRRNTKGKPSSFQWVFRNTK